MDKIWFNSNLGRTTKTSLPKYSNDGYGRDAYISYDNAGIWKENIKQIKSKSNYEEFHLRPFHSLKSYPAPFKYIQDGTGRDLYIIKDQGGLVKFFTPLAIHFHNCLFRSQVSPQTKFKFKYSKYELENQQHRQKIQKGIINRLYLKEIYKINKKNKILYNNTIYNPALRAPKMHSIYRSFSCQNLYLTNK